MRTDVQLSTQKRLIHQHLCSLDDTGKRRGLSADEARSLYQVRRLAARIEELRNDGHVIVSVRKEDPLGRPYTRYYLED